jgi:hypothetical protein
MPLTGWRAAKMSPTDSAYTSDRSLLKPSSATASDTLRTRRGTAYCVEFTSRRIREVSDWSRAMIRPTEAADASGLDASRCTANTHCGRVGTRSMYRTIRSHAAFAWASSCIGLPLMEHRDAWRRARAHRWTSRAREAFHEVLRRRGHRA